MKMKVSSSNNRLGRQYVESADPRVDPQCYAGGNKLTTLYVVQLYYFLSIFSPSYLTVDRRN